MKLLYTILIPFLVAIPCLSQTNVKGIVRDGNGRPIKSVVVKLCSEGGHLLAYGLTNQEGIFDILIPYTYSLPIRIMSSHVGYKQQTLLVKNASERQYVVMERGNTVLPEVTIKGTPIMAIGDTLHYHVSQFRKFSDRTLEDVLRRLPGIHVEESGRITYRGEGISKFYIEGLDLLSGQYAIATRNLKVDDIAAVSVYENHQPQRVLRGIQFSDKAALNIKLKEGRKFRPFGSVTLGCGAGSEGLWIGEGFGMYAGSRGQSLVTLKGNNTGGSYGDEHRFLVETGLPASSPLSDLFIKQPFSSNKLSSDRYKQNTSFALSYNHIMKMKKDVVLSVNTNYVSDVFDYSSVKRTVFFDGSNRAVSVSNSNHSDIHAKQVKTNFKLESNKEKVYLLDNLSLAGTFTSNHYAIHEGVRLRQDIGIREYHVKNSLNTTVRHHNKVFVFSSDIALAHLPKNQISAAEEDKDSLVVSQEFRTTTFQTREKTEFTWMLGNHADLALKVNFDSYYVKLNENLIRNQSNTTDAGNGYKLTTTFIPQFQYHRSRLRFKFDLPISVYNLKVQSRTLNEDGRFDRIGVGVSMSAHYSFKANTNLSLTVGRHYSVGDVLDYFAIPVYETYRDRSNLGYGHLKESHTTSATATFNYRNTLSGLFMTIRGTWMMADRNTMKSSLADREKTIYKTEGRKNRSTTSNMYIYASKNFYEADLQLSMMGNATYGERKMARQDREYTLKSRMFDIDLSMRKGWLHGMMSTDVTYKMMYNKRLVDTESHSKLVEHKLYIHLTVNPIAQLELFVKSGYHHGSLQQNAYHSLFLDSGVRYKARRMELELQLKNLNNRQSFEYCRIDGFDTYSYTYQLRPMEGVLLLKYTL